MIDLLTVKELPEVADLAQWYFYQCQCPGQFNKEQFVKSWTQFIGLDLGFIIKRSCDCGIAEAIGMMVYPDPWTGNLSSSCAFWYTVNEDKTLAGGLLYHALTEELAKRNVRRCFMTALINHRHDLVSQFLLKDGFVPVEVNYLKEMAN